MDTHVAPAAPLVPVRRPAAWVWYVRAVLFGALALTAVFGTPVTRVAAGLALLLGILADRDGFIRHSLRLTGFALAVVGAPYLAPLLASGLGGLAPGGPMMGQVLAFAAALLIWLIVIGFAARGITGVIRRSPQLYALNAAAGGLLGTVEAAFLVSVGCWMLQASAGPLTALQARQSAENEATFARIADFRDAVLADPAAQVLTRANPVLQSEGVASVADFALVAGNPDGARRLLDDVRVRSFLEQPAMRRHLEAFRTDTTLREAARTHDFGSILGSNALKSMMGDGELFAALRTNWEPLNAAVADVARQLQSHAAATE